MSNEALNYVWEKSESKHIARLVLLSIADRADRYGRAFCSAEDLCRRVNADRTSVFRALAVLRELGELVVEAVKGPGGCNRYLLPKVAEAAGLRRFPDGKMPPHALQDATGSSGNLPTPTSGKLPPKPSSNPPRNPAEREEVMKLHEAIAMFEKEFPDKPVRSSLFKMSGQFRRALTPSACRAWLEREREVKTVKKSLRARSWDEANPEAAGGEATAPAAPAQPSDPRPPQPEVMMELEYINPGDIDRARFAAFVVKNYKDYIASWTPFSAPQAVLRQYLRSVAHLGPEADSHGDRIDEPPG